MPAQKTEANLYKFYAVSTPSIKMIHKWFIEIRCVRTNTKTIPSHQVVQKGCENIRHGKLNQ